MSENPPRRAVSKGNEERCDEHTEDPQHHDSRWQTGVPEYLIRYSHDQVVERWLLRLIKTEGIIRLGSETGWEGRERSLAGEPLLGRQSPVIIVGYERQIEAVQAIRRRHQA